MNIVFLNLAVMPYHVAVFRALISKGYHCIVYWYGTSPKTAYRAPIIDGLELYNRFDFKDTRSLFEHSSRFNPRVVVSCGWTDRRYNMVCRLFRKSKIPTLSMSDTQWNGGKQWLNRLLSPFQHKRYFDYIWGAGILQFDYARKLGFKPRQILMNCFSGDYDTFSKIPIEEKEKEYPKRFLFVGRFVHVKAIDVLLEAWMSIEDKNGWTLELIGDGPLKEKFRQKYPDVIIKDFMSQSKLVEEAKQSGCFIIPSRFEPWALVIHEFAFAGLPIISSDACGAARQFVINGHNGYIAKSGDVKSLRDAINKIIHSDQNTLIQYSKNSRYLAETVTPDIVSDTLLSTIK